MKINPLKVNPFRTLLSRRAPEPVPAEAHLAGTSFVEQEPDLAKETGLTAREVSGWAMGGSGALD